MPNLTNSAKPASGQPGHPSISQIRGRFRSTVQWSPADWQAPLDAFFDRCRAAAAREFSEWYGGHAPSDPVSPPTNRASAAGSAVATGPAPRFTGDVELPPNFFVPEPAYLNAEQWRLMLDLERLLLGMRERWEMAKYRECLVRAAGRVEGWLRENARVWREECGRCKELAGATTATQRQQEPAGTQEDFFDV